MHESLLNASSEALYNTDKVSFMMDATLNEVREFLVGIVTNPASEQEAVAYAIKILLLLGTARANAEDLLAVSNLLEQRGGAPVPALQAEVFMLGAG